MSAIRLAIAGAGGRMGRALLEAASTVPGTVVSAALEAPASPLIGRDAGELCAGAKGIAIGPDLAAAVASSDALIDFTRPAGTMVHLAACVKAGKALVIGTTVSAALEAPASPLIGRDAGELCAGAKGVTIGSDLAAAVAASDSLIDFTRPAGTMAHLAACMKAGKALVIGTTGFEPHELEAIRAGAASIPIVLAPNFSIGVNVALKLVDLASRALGPDYDVEVFEMHHKLKVDAPSGTALKLGEVAARARGTTLAQDGVYARHGVTGERKGGTIGFSVARGGDVIGDHTVYFAGTGERIEITHRSNSRATYAQGAIRAARWLVGRAPGLYGMDDVLGIKG